MQKKVFNDVEEVNEIKEKPKRAPRKKKEPVNDNEPPIEVRLPLQYIEIEDGIPINKIDFDKVFEKRKYPYSFLFLRERSFTLQEQYVRTGKAPVKPLVSVAEARAAAASANTAVVILFEDPQTNDYGFLSLKWTVEIEFNNTMYNSAKQAIAAELAKVFNDQESLQKIMIADTPEEVSYELDDVPGEENQAKWNDNIKQLLYDVNIAKFNQYPELVARLLETKTAVLGAYIPNDNLIGIGLSLDNIQSKNPINWTGQNLLGKALMDIREKFRMDMALITEGTIPEGTIPEGTIPEGTIPEGTIPEGTIPEGTIPESAIAQRVVRRRKPAVAKPVTDLAEEAIEAAIEAPMEEIKPVIAVEPRTIRRRPIPALAPPTQLAFQQPISLGNIPININKQ
jgi:ribA/ribD-fused uncharacterized protein